MAPVDACSAWRRVLNQDQLKLLWKIALVVQIPFFVFGFFYSRHGPGAVVLWWCNTALQVSLYNGFFGFPQLSRVPLVDLPMNVWAWLLPLHFSWLFNEVEVRKSMQLFSN